MSSKRLPKSGLHKRIIAFFKSHPESIDTPRGVATWVGCSREEAKKALDELVKAGMLNSILTSSTSGYSLKK
ncbi:MAG: hypothetical protein HQ558_04495 [Candidatus Omnitrophica bacterium]|nr:hypothetical protein [Candidatus Omnitrophota bacterium]